MISEQALVYGVLLLEMVSLENRITRAKGKELAECKTRLTKVEKDFEKNLEGLDGEEKRTMQVALNKMSPKSKAIAARRDR